MRKDNYTDIKDQYMGTPPHRTVTAFIPLTGYKTEILLTVILICNCSIDKICEKTMPGARKSDAGVLYVRIIRFTENAPRIFDAAAGVGFLQRCLCEDCKSVYYSSQSAEEMYDILSIMKMYACITAENMSK